MTTEAPIPALSIRWKWVLLVWLVPATLSTLQLLAGYVSRGVFAAEWPYAALQFPRWILWAVLTPVVFAALRRYPIARGRWQRSIAMHLLLSVAITVAVESLLVPLTIWVSVVRNPGSVEEMPSVGAIVGLALLGRVVPNALTYAAVLGVASTLESREAARRRDMAAEHLRAQLAAAQLSALKVQLHPHFLFNTLQAVNVLIERDPAAATRMVSRLGDLLRHTLSRAQTHEVTLADELDLVRRYLEIELVRFSDRLTVEYDVPRELSAAAVPDLLLQPLVENAIKHGIAQVSGADQLLIRAVRDGASLDLFVMNSRHRGSAADPIVEGIGHASTRGRLAALYGAAASLRFHIDSTGRAVAHVRVPYRELTPSAADA